MTGLLEGRSAIVTGAGRGIGRAIAESLVAEGASVIVADNGASIGGDGGDPAVARETAAALGKKAIAFPDSVASPGAAKLLVEMAVKNFGGIDIVVNNAGIVRDAFVFRADPRDWDAVIHNNLSSAFYLINAASAVMREQGKSGRGGPPKRADTTGAASSASCRRQACMETSARRPMPAPRPACSG
jgi:NAD(P)-dependent dehydrogenase (short-subunit alcohol dehydrogenase family)